jgi:acyl carrier protein
MEKIEAILKELIPTADFSKNKSFTGQNRLDSLDLIKLVTNLEVAFKITINASDLLPENFEDVLSVENLVLKSLKDQKK